MVPYYLTFLLVAAFSFLAMENREIVGIDATPRREQLKNVGLLGVALTLICVSGLRYYVGTDFGAYYRIWSNSAFNDLWGAVKKLDEPGFPLLATIIGWFTHDGAVFIFVAAAFTLGAILYTTYKHTDTYFFSSLLIIFTGVWHGSFNGVRQYFAAAIICLGYRFIAEKKFWKYVLVVFVAYLFHKSAIIMIVPYFILRNKISVKNLLLLTVGSFILLSNYEAIFSLIGSVHDQAMDVTDSYMQSQVNILRIIVSVVPAVFCLFLYGEGKKDAETTLHLNILILYAMLSIVGMNSPYLSRINIYLSVLLPLSMGKLIVFKDKKLELLVKTLILVLYFLFSLYEISNSDSLNHFRWIWER